jgi:hypothetical protein
VPGDLGLATTHLAQSSSASRFMAGASEFFILSQSGERPERERESFHFERGRGPKSNFRGPKNAANGARGMPAIPIPARWEALMRAADQQASRDNEEGQAPSARESAR